MAEARSDPQQQALDAIRALSADYLAKLPAKLDEIEQAWRALSTEGWNLEAARDLHRAVHSITGAGRIFGLPKVSEAARALEQGLQVLLETSPSAPAAMYGGIALALSQLRSAADQAG